MLAVYIGEKEQTDKFYPGKVYDIDIAYNFILDCFAVCYKGYVELLYEDMKAVSKDWKLGCTIPTKYKFKVAIA